MTQAQPPGYPPSSHLPYGAPPARSGNPARSAGILLLVMGVLALLFSGGIIANASVYEDLRNTPQFQDNADLQKLQQQLDALDVSMKSVAYVFAGLVGAYGLVAVILGVLLLRTRGQGATITALVIVILVSLFWGLNLLGSLASANVGAILLAALILGPHVLAIWWLLQALRNRSAAPAMYQTMPTPNASFPPPPGSYPPGYGQPAPMQGYRYQPPPPPPASQQQPPPTA